MLKALSIVFGVGPTDQSKLLARYKKLQAIGIPSGQRPGRGEKSGYSDEQICEVAFYLQLNELGLPPDHVREISLELKQRFLSPMMRAFSGEAIADVLLSLHPRAMSKSWGGTPEFTIGRLGSLRVRDTASGALIVDLVALGKQIRSAVKDAVAEPVDTASYTFGA